MELHAPKFKTYLGGILVRKEFIDALNITDAKRIAPWAKKIVKIEYGYLAFEDFNEYLIWHKKAPK